MRIFTRHSLVVFAAFLLYVGCSQPPHTASVTPLTAPDVVPKGAHLSKAEAIRIAKAAAVHHGVELRDYEEPEADYEFSRKDKTWFVFFKGRVLMPGNFFSVYVDDQTREAQFVEGK